MWCCWLSLKVSHFDDGFIAKLSQPSFCPILGQNVLEVLPKFFSNQAHKLHIMLTTTSLAMAQIYAIISRAIAATTTDGDFPEGIKTSQYHKVAKVSKPTATRHLAYLVEVGCLARTGAGGRSTRYVLNKV